MITKQESKELAIKNHFEITEDENDKLKAVKKIQGGVELHFCYSIQDGKGYIQLFADIGETRIWSFGDFILEDVADALWGWHYPA